jgi:DNA-binding transcriptional LysR family regulator
MENAQVNSAIPIGVFIVSPCPNVVRARCRSDHRPKRCIICTFDVQIAMSVAATLPNLEAFVASADALSFSAAAKHIGVTPQAVSRAVARLEATLGVTLFRRTTRSLHLTDAGAQYQRACVASLQQLQSAEETLRSTEERVAGRLRISAPTSYGHAVLPHVLATFRDKHPRVDVELSLSNRTVDFTRDGCDLAVRMGDLHDHPTLKRVPLGGFALGVFASSAYLKRNGTPMAIADIDDHSTIVFVLPRTNRPLQWVLHQHGEPTSVLPKHRVSVADDVMGLLSLAAAGLGLIQTYDMMAAPLVARGELQEVLHDARGESRPFSLVWPSDTTPHRATRAFIQHARSQASR